MGNSFARAIDINVRLQRYSPYHNHELARRTRLLGERWKKLKKAQVKRETSEEIDLLDTMLSSLVELLEEKGIITQEEWEKRIKDRITIK